MSDLDFRKETERKLWIFLFALSAFLLMVLIWGALETLAVTVRTNEITTSDYSIDNFAPQHDVARGPDNIIRHAYPTTNLAVNMSYSSDNGTTWTEINILAAAYQGATVVNVRGVCISSNNTTIVLVRTNDADSVYDIYLLIRWGWFGSWEIVRVHGNLATDYQYAQCAINDTDIILMMFQFSTGLSYKTFSLDTQILDPSVGFNPIVWSGSVSGAPMLAANKTGKFWVGWTQWDGSDSCLYADDFEFTKTVLKIPISGLWYIYLNAMGCIPTTGAIYFVLGCNYSTYEYKYIYFYYMRDNRNYFEGPGLLTYFLPSVAMFEKYIGATHDATGMVYIFYYDGTDHKLKGMRCEYTESAIQWAASKYDVITGYTSTDYVNCADGIGQLWPQVNGVPVGTSMTGWFMSWVWKNEEGVVDDYNYQLAWDSAIWPFIFWTPPTIGNYTLPNWYTTEPYLHKFFLTNGNSPYIWWITFNTPSNGGWFWVDSTGTMYGYCPGTIGTYSITVHVMDFYGLTTTRTTALTVLSRLTGGGTGGTSVSWDWPTLNEQGELWMLLAVVSMVSCCLGLIKRFGKSKWLRRG